MPAVDPPTPTSTLTDEQLWNLQLLAAIQCGHGNYAIKQKVARNICALANVLHLEANLRGVPQPQPPYSLGRLKA